MSTEAKSIQVSRATGGASEVWIGGVQRDIAKEAYEEAIQYFRAEFKGKNKALAWVDTLVSMEEVQTTISDIQKQYEANVKYVKARAVLHRFSAVVLHYGKVLDMLSQQHPEYVSLVWGSVKFLLTGVLGHARLVAEYAEALVCIGDVLPRAQLSAALYQNDMMRAAVARLYAQLLRFFRAAVEWYSRSGFERAVNAVFKPFECGLKDVVEKIKTCAELMDKIAESSMRVDQRLYNVELQARLERVEAWCCRSDQTLGVLTATVEGLRNKVHEIHEDTQDTRWRVGDMQPRVRGIEFRMELKTLEPKVLPAQVLARQRSVQRAQQSWTMQNQDIVTLIQALGEWMDAPACALLILDAPRGKHIATELIASVLQPRTQRICWSLSTATGKDEAQTTAQILSSLVWQLHRLDVAKAAMCLNGNVDHGDESQMAELLRLILVQLGDCYVVVEVVDIMKSAGNNAAQLHHLSTVLQTMLDQVSSEGGRVKILLVSGGVMARLPVKDTAASTANEYASKVISLGPGLPIPASRQRHGTRTFFQNPGWLNLRNRVTKNR